MNISDIPEPYLTVIKIVLVAIVYGLATRLAKYIYYEL